ncbi:MAG: alpha/beta fold hydrolase, partial [Verrucomicrobiota bacterium]
MPPLDHQRLAPTREISIPLSGEAETIEAFLSLPNEVAAVIVFAHGSGSSRHSSRNQEVARLLQRAGFATLLLDLLTPTEERTDRVTRQYRFDIPRLARRVVEGVRWAREHADTRDLPIGTFGASTGAAAALIAAAELPHWVGAVVSRGGRPDLAGAALGNVRAPTRLIVGERDERVIELNEEAYAQLEKV